MENNTPIVIGTAILCFACFVGGLKWGECTTWKDAVKNHAGHYEIINPDNGKSAFTWNKN